MSLLNNYYNNVNSMCNEHALSIKYYFVLGSKLNREVCQKKYIGTLKIYKLKMFFYTHRYFKFIKFGVVNLIKKLNTKFYRLRKSYSFQQYDFL